MQMFVRSCQTCLELTIFIFLAQILHDDFRKTSGSVRLTLGSLKTQGMDKTLWMYAAVRYTLPWSLAWSPYKIGYDCFMYTLTLSDVVCNQPCIFRSRVFIREGFKKKKNLTFVNSGFTPPPPPYF